MKLADLPVSRVVYGFEWDDIEWPGPPLIPRPKKTSFRFYKDSSERIRRWREANPDRVKQHHKNYHLSHREQHRQYEEKRRRKLGIPVKRMCPRMQRTIHVFVFGHRLYMTKETYDSFYNHKPKKRKSFS